MPETEILVIGGGIAGASTALHLAEAGRSVTLLERGEIAGEASGVNMGGIGSLGWGNLPDLEAHLTMGSLQIFKRLQLEMGYDIEFRQSGALTAIQTDAEFDYARDRVNDLRSLGYDIELLSVDEVRSIEPEVSPELHGFTYSPLRSQADPVKSTQAFAAAAEREGARILTGHEVSQITASKADGSYVVSAGGTEFHAVTLVLAARRELANVPGKDRTSLGLALDDLCAVTPEELVAMEVIWSPADPNDRMSLAGMEERYPELYALGELLYQMIDSHREILRDAC